MRIIAGRFKGRALGAPRGLATRPTSDRVREALFSILGDVEDLPVLDLYAGSGALGLEALSRGAVSATFVEEARAPLLALRANVAELGVSDQATVIGADVRAAIRRLARESARFGIVFADPPYADRDTPGTLEALLASGIVLDGGWIVLEHAAKTAPPGGGARLALRFTRVYGDTALSFYRHSTTETA
ncbi:MAG: 16S rRNA (guanine(966)-N(2))-methyltransferase RsmD [Candidatus Eisenbacteria bacterium]